jgi:hypothetical protein
MEQKNNIFSSAFQAFRDTPVRFLTFSLVCIALFLVYSQHDIIVNKLVSPTAFEESQLFDSSIGTDILINSALDQFITQYGAEAVKIAQYHNGQYDLTSLPFQKTSVTYLVGQSSSNIELYNPRPLSTMAFVNQTIWKGPNGPECAGFVVEKMGDYAFRSRLRDLGYSFVYICPIANIREYPIGYMSVSYKDIPPESIMRAMGRDASVTASKVSGYLQEGKRR